MTQFEECIELIRRMDLWKRQLVGAKKSGKLETISFNEYKSRIISQEEKLNYTE
jgi:hypothetical protein